MRGRVSGWWRPTIAVPTLSEPEESPGAAMSSGSPSAGLAALFGHAHGVNVYVVSPRGVEIPVNNAIGWTVIDLHSLLHEIDTLPELRPDSRRA